MIAVTITTRPMPAEHFTASCLTGPVIGNTVLNSPNIGLVSALHRVYQLRSREDILAFVHDDVEIHENGWAERLRKEFDDPRVAVVGLGGALGIGVPDIYKVPYHISQLQRIDYFSNQRDWQIHGKRETATRDVAVIDGFFMAVRTEFLNQTGGFAWMKTRFHCYDTALCLMAYRRGWNVRIVGIDCTHYGGGTSTKPEYIEWCRENGTTPEREHREPHAWMYNEFRKEMPLCLK